MCTNFVVQKSLLVFHFFQLRVNEKLFDFALSLCLYFLRRFLADAVLGTINKEERNAVKKSDKNEGKNKR